MQTSPPSPRADAPVASAPGWFFPVATAAVLVASFGLRVRLVLGGGQQFWPDEDRFEVARVAARALRAGHVHEAFAAIFAGADHLLFKALAVIPAYVELARKAPPWVPALFFAGVSTWVVWLVGRVARAAGADAAERFFATLLAAGASSLFYYSRHFFPYDLSLGFFLAALIASLSPSADFRRGLLTGLWASLGFLAYNGYWMIGAVVLVAHTVTPPWSAGALLRRAAGAGLGLVAPLVVVLGIGRALGVDLVASYVAFSKTVFQGDYGIAWRFVGEYLWHAEHGLAVGWGFALVAALGFALRRRAPPRTLRWLALTSLLYAALVAPSDLFAWFTVSARHVRALVPFLCLLAAALLAALWRRGGGPRALAASLALAVTAQTGYNLTAPLRQTFEAEFRARATAFLPGAVSRDLGPYRLVNAGFLHNPDWPWVNRPGDVTVFRQSHPFEFAPYLYEGYSESARARFRAKDLSMRVVRLAAGGPPFAGYPGVIRLTLRFPLVARGLQPDPLVTAGRNGLGDVLFIRYEGPDAFRIGLDHWGYQAIYSDPVALDRTKPHTFTISMGTLFAPDDPARPDRLRVTLDDRVVFDVPAAFHACPAESILIGMNLIGASTAVPELTAEIVSCERVRAP